MNLIGTIWRHKKTQGLYRIKGICRFEATDTAGILYQEVRGGTVWARDRNEFLDGRFEHVPQDTSGKKK